MQARGSLMIEHRLIERMLSVISAALSEIEARHQVDPVFVDTAVDFIKVYADRTHHGKEEEILFKELAQKPLAAQDRETMDDLIQEHVFGRRTTEALVAANARYRQGERKAIEEIAAALKTLVDFYPGHIEKEDKQFFPRARTYFSDSEDQAILARFNAFDQEMIHEKYRQLVVGFENT